MKDKKIVTKKLSIKCLIISNVDEWRKTFEKKIIEEEDRRQKKKNINKKLVKVSVFFFLVYLLGVIDALDSLIISSFASLYFEYTHLKKTQKKFYFVQSKQKSFTNVAEILKSIQVSKRFSVVLPIDYTILIQNRTTTTKPEVKKQSFQFIWMLYFTLFFPFIAWDVIKLFSFFFFCADIFICHQISRSNEQSVHARDKTHSLSTEMK